MGTVALNGADFFETNSVFSVLKYAKCLFFNLGDVKKKCFTEIVLAFLLVSRAAILNCSAHLDISEQIKKAVIVVTLIFGVNDLIIKAIISVLKVLTGFSNFYYANFLSIS